MNAINVNSGREKGKERDQEEMEEDGVVGVSASIHLSSLMRSESYRNSDIDNNPENTTLLLSLHPFHHPA